MVTLARSQRTTILHYISNVICSFISVIVEMQKKKNTHFVTHALKIRVQMLLTATACFVQPRRWLWSPADLCLWGEYLSRCTNGIGELLECSEKDTISPNHDRCIFRFDVILQDICGNVHLHFSICFDIFLLASRYNKKKKKERKEEILFQRKLFSLSNEDPHYNVGPKEGTQEKGAKAGS